ncbi:unnamed protein product [Paramecium primaurelia]|uniref:Nudix hydrolase domain-containing protein n=1 Tax=Paramecium primaurelia TaxID=5886 RepID=A0A8S1MYC1_PARPR|nr:unnamed protein product [Paramecium primaurelia]
MLNLISPQQYIPYKNTQTNAQSAVCILLRGQFKPQQGYSQLNINYPQSTKFQQQQDIEILYIQRQNSKRDQYSGEIAFPGGKCDNDETDLQAAIREVYEEVGINLNDLECYYVCRLSKNAYMKKLRNKQSLYCSAFVIAINDPNKKTDNMRLSENEIQQAKWIKLTYFDDPILKTKKSLHYFGPRLIAKYFKQSETAALDIGFEEMLYGFTFFMTIALLFLIQKHQKVWQHAHFAKFTFTGPMKYILEYGAMIVYKKERISLIEQWQWPIYIYLIPLLILMIILI